MIFGSSTPINNIPEVCEYFGKVDSVQEREIDSCYREINFYVKQVYNHSLIPVSYTIKKKENCANIQKSNAVIAEKIGTNPSNLIIKQDILKVGDLTSGIKNVFTNEIIDNDNITVKYNFPMCQGKIDFSDSIFSIFGIMIFIGIFSGIVLWKKLRKKNDTNK